MAKNSTLLSSSVLDFWKNSKHPRSVSFPSLQLQNILKRLHRLRFCLTIQLHNPFCSGYANGGPIIKINDVRNDKPTGRRGARVKSPQGSGLIWMLTAKTQKKNKKHSSDGYNSVMCKLGKWNWGDGFASVIFLWVTQRPVFPLVRPASQRGKWKMHLKQYNAACP